MTRFHRALYLLLPAFVASCAGPSRAAVVYATSGYPADLQAAIDSAHTGDTVFVPAGRFSFEGSVLAPDGIYIKGAGRDRTFLIKDDDTSNFMIMVDSKTACPSNTPVRPSLYRSR